MDMRFSSHACLMRTSSFSGFYALRHVALNFAESHAPCLSVAGGHAILWYHQVQGHAHAKFYFPSSIQRREIDHFVMWSRTIMKVSGPAPRHYEPQSCAAFIVICGVQGLVRKTRHEREIFRVALHFASHKAEHPSLLSVR